MINLSHKLNPQVLKLIEKYQYKDNEASEECLGERLPSFAKNFSQVYSYTIEGIDGVNPIQLIDSWESQRFRDIMTNIDLEHLDCLWMNTKLQKYWTDRGNITYFE